MSDYLAIPFGGRLPDVDAAITTLSSQIRQSFSTATVGPGFATDTYLAGSAIPMGATPPVAGAIYRLIFDMTKTAAGTQAPIVRVRFGTAGTTADPVRLTFTFGVGTAATDTGTFEVFAHFRTVGASAVLSGVARLNHLRTTTGLVNSGSVAVVPVVSSTFDSTPANSFLGASFQGGTSFAGTCTLAQAVWSNP